MQRQRRKLTVEVAIDLRRQDGWGVRAIARELGRSPSVISTEIGRGRKPDGSYAAGSAQALLGGMRDAALPYDIVFTDRIMPDMDGIALLRSCRADRRFDRTAFVI